MQQAPPHDFPISILSLNTLDEEQLRQRILACASTLNLEFVFSSATQAKILFLSKDSAFAHIMLNKAKNDDSLSLIFISPIDHEKEPDNLFYQGWPYISSSIATNTLSTLLQEYIYKNHSSSEQKNTKLSQYRFSTLTELTEYLYKLIVQRKQYFSISNGQKTIFLNLDKNIFYLDTPQNYDFDQSNTSINKLLIHFKSGGSIHELTEDSCYLSERYQAYMAHRFLWLLAEQMTKKLLIDIGNTSAFGISHWPDFGSLKTDPLYLRVCASLIRTPLTLIEIKNKLKIPKIKVIAFLNGALLCQHLIYGSNLRFEPKSTVTNTVTSLSREEIFNCRKSLSIESN